MIVVILNWKELKDRVHEPDLYLNQIFLYRKIAFRSHKYSLVYEWFAPSVPFTFAALFSLDAMYETWYRLELMCQDAISSYGEQNVIIVEATSDEDFEKVDMRKIGTTLCPQSPPSNPK
jgi:hypothetical protein